MVGLVRTLFAIGRAIGPKPSSEIGGWWTRRLGRLLPQHRIALANARAAFPDKSQAEIASIVGDAWENIGRTGTGYAHLKVVIGDAGRVGRIELVGMEHLAAL